MGRGIQETGICSVTIIIAIIVSGYIFTTYLGVNTSLFVIMGTFLVILYVLVTGAVSVMVKGNTPTHLFVAKPRNPSLMQRVVFDEITRKEHIISGTPSQSFRSACKDDWVFRSMKASDGWIIKDERGNDISDTSLTDYQGIATLASTEPAKSSGSYYDKEEEETDRTEEYSDIERGVTFYD
ncbi:MAG: hypothetical protein P1Q69_06805 [Candidatus Thorarchaeota archaeon]|nr:hypothetical protein [Candidatus Thorarchaeota archaeon]